MVAHREVLPWSYTTRRDVIKAFWINSDSSSVKELSIDESRVATLTRSKSARDSEDLVMIHWLLSTDVLPACRLIAR